MNYVQESFVQIRIDYSSSSTTKDTINRPTNRWRSSQHCNIRHCLLGSILVILTTTLTTLATRIDCELYIAKSTIPQAGIGIFSGVAKSTGDSIGNGDKAIPVVDFYWHAGDYSDDVESLDEGESAKFFNPLEDYVWHGVGMGMEYESMLDDDVSAFWPGVDAMVNCNLGLVNVQKATPVYDEAGIHRNLHPGAGGITPYGPGRTEVIRDIPAGGEIFKHYGDEWFTGRSHFNKIPLTDDYGNIVTMMTDWRTKIEALYFSEKQLATIYDELILPMKEIWTSRTLNALHDFSWKDMERAIDAQDVGVVLQKNATRSIDWLDQHGKCIDHIVHGRSTIEGAGDGAFAKRELPRGTVITGSPLIHFPFRSIMDMFDPKPSSSGSVIRDVQKGPYGQQLLINYCFGHPESTILLCPYGAGVNYINANRTLANVKVQWSEDGNTNHNAEWLNTKPEDMEWVSKTMLAMDYVALRDIKAGEELFLDYGEAWEQAWEAHVNAWKAVTDREEYISATQFNDMHADLPVRTHEEQIEDPYPNNLQINCHPALVDEAFQELNYDGLYKNGRDFIEQVGWVPEHRGFECDVWKRDDATGLYEVTNKNERKRHRHVPRKAMQFVDVPYTTDLHLVDAFRHPIGIPDDILPEAWRNMECNTV